MEYYKICFDKTSKTGTVQVVDTRFKKADPQLGKYFKFDRGLFLTVFRNVSLDGTLGRISNKIFSISQKRGSANVFTGKIQVFNKPDERGLYGLRWPSHEHMKVIAKEGQWQVGDLIYPGRLFLNREK